MVDLATQFIANNSASQSPEEEQAHMNDFAKAGHILAHYRIDQNMEKISPNAYWQDEDGYMILFSDYSAVLMILSAKHETANVKIFPKPAEDADYQRLFKLLALGSSEFEHILVQYAKTGVLPGMEDKIFLAPTEISKSKH